MKKCRYIIVLWLLLIVMSSMQAHLIYYQDGSIFDSLSKKNLGLDVSKYGQACNYLLNVLGISKSYFLQPGQVDDSELSAVHTVDYLDSIRSTKGIINVFKRGGLKPSVVMKWTPSSILRPQVHNEYKRAAHCMSLGVDKVLEAKGFAWAICFSGGYPHAEKDAGRGWEFFNDFALAINKAHQKNKDCKILVVNLDLHPATALADICKDKKNVGLFDIYTQADRYIDHSLLAHIAYAHQLERGATGATYLQLLEEKLKGAIEDFKPDVILYNAGSDIYQYDPFNKSNFGISGHDIINRDERVFCLAKENNISIVMALGSGFEKNVGKDVIGPSVHNLFQKGLIAL